MTNKNDEEEVEIGGVVYSFRCDICWQQLDDTDIQFKPCNRCHLQVCLFCFNKHTNQKESYSKTCPKCREPIDMKQIMKQSVDNSNNKNSVAKKLLSVKKTNNKRKRKKSKKDNNNNYDDYDHNNNNYNNNNNNNNNIDIDEEVPKTDWKNYLKGRFISRDSIIVAPVIAKFNNEDAISDNFKAYGRITRINMWDDESAHIMYDKQYFADALVDKIQDVAVRYQGQFGLMSAKYHFRRPCEEFMDPDRRCPMQCRKFHGPYYKIDFIPLDQYLDEEARKHWIEERKKHVSSIIKARYKKFRKKYMDGSPLPIVGDKYNDDYGKKKDQRVKQQHYDYYDDENYDENYDEDGNYMDNYQDYGATSYRNNRYNKNNGYRSNNRYYNRYNNRYNNNNNNNHNGGNKNAITLKYTAMGKANKLLALDDSLQKHMRNKPNQPLPPTRPPPPVPLNNNNININNNNNNNNNNINNINKDNEETKSIKSVSTNNDNNSNSESVSSGKRTRPPIHHTTSAQMRPFMNTINNINITPKENDNGINKNNKVKKLMAMQKIQRTKSDDHSDFRPKEVKMAKIMPLRSTKSDPNTEYSNNNNNDNDMNNRKGPYHEERGRMIATQRYYNGDEPLPPRLCKNNVISTHNNDVHNSGDSFYVNVTNNNHKNNIFSVSSSNLQTNMHQFNNLNNNSYSRSSSNLKNNVKPKNKIKTVDLLKSLKKKKRKQRGDHHHQHQHQQQQKVIPTRHPIPHHSNINRLTSKDAISTFKPHNNIISGGPPNLHAITPNNNNNNNNNNNPININPAALNMNMSINNNNNNNNNNNHFNPYSLSSKTSPNNPYYQSKEHTFNPLTKEFKPTTTTRTGRGGISGFDAITPVKKSKLNANAAPYIAPSSKNTFKSSSSSQPAPHFKLPKIGHNTNNNIKNFDIRNLGPLITDNDILNRDHKDYAYDFGKALDESHLDLHRESNQNEQEEIEEIEEIEQNDIDKLYNDKQSHIDDNKEYNKDDDDKMNIDEANECYTASSDDSSDDDYDKAKWTQDLLWNKVCDIVKTQRLNNNNNNNNIGDNWCNWQNIRKLLKQRMTISDWTYVKDNKLVKKVKARFRIEFEKKDKKEIDNMYNMNNDNNDNGESQPILSGLLEKQSLRTTEANSFANLKYDECSVIDLDLRISDIRNYMTDLLTQNNTTSMPSQYDTTIIAELGQILSIYQSWIDDKKQLIDNNMNDENNKQISIESMERIISNNTIGTEESNDGNIDDIDEQHAIKQLFGTPAHQINDNHIFVTHNNNNNNNNDNNESDFYSRLLDEVQQKAMFEHEDHEYHDDDTHNPKDLVMDYIGFNKNKNDEQIKHNMNNNQTIITDEELYDYEYSDVTDDEQQEQIQIIGGDHHIKNNQKMDDSEPESIKKVYNLMMGNKDEKEQEIQQKEFEEIAYDEDTGSHKDDDHGNNDDDDNDDDLLVDSIVLSDDHDDDKNELITNKEQLDGDIKMEGDDDDIKEEDISPPIEPVDDEEELYQYDDDDTENENENEQTEENKDLNGDSFGSPIFSRVHSPPPRHRNNLKEDEYFDLNEEDKDKMNDNNINNNNIYIGNNNNNNNNNNDTLIDRHYYNARYPPRRGRYGRNMDNGNSNYYRARNQNSRYNVNKNKNKNSPNAPKMEWKKKEKEVTDNNNNTQLMDNNNEEK